MTKSRLFTTVFENPHSESAEAFARHLGETLSLDENVRNRCLEEYPHVRLMRTKTERRERIDALSRELQIDRHLLEHALSVTGFLCNELLSESLPVTDPEQWGNDFVELGWIDATARSTFGLLVDRIKSFGTQIQPEIRRRRAAGGVLPVFAGCGITVEQRAVQQNEFRMGMDVDSYVSQIVDTTSVASVHITVDEGIPKDFYFQVEEYDLDYLIATFRGAKKDMAALRMHLRVDRKNEEAKDNDV